MRHFIAIISIVLFFFTSCKKDSDPLYNPAVKADLSVEFDNIAGSSDLALNTGSYTNSSGEVFTVTKLKYYVSNFVLTNTNGTVYTVPQDSSYFLIDESNEATHEVELHLPEGEYKTLQFIVGVDSLRSTKSSSERTGVLDPATTAADMYWNENEGYVFFNVEGTSSSSTTADKSFQYHIGGYGGSTSATFNNLKTVTLDLTQRGVAQVKSGRHSDVHLMTDVLKFFDGNTQINIATHPVVMFDDFSVTIADNFNGMFRHDHTHND